MSHPIFGDVTVKQYARYLERVVRRHFARWGVDIMKIRNDDGDLVRSWRQLNSVVDANEFLLMTEDHFGIVFDPATDPEWDLYISFTERATDIVITQLGWKKGRQNA